jgi:methionyl-tRNA synthetase
MEKKVPALGALSALEDELTQSAKTHLEAARAAWLALEPHRALEATFAVAGAANQYVDRAAPWASVKSDPARAATQLALLLEVLAALSIAIWPAMPKKSDAMRAQLGLAPLAPRVGSDLFPRELGRVLEAGRELAPSGPLFPKLDEKARKEILDRLSPAPEPGAADAKPAETTPATDASPPITSDDFTKVDLRVGVVKTCEKVPRKDKLLRLTVDLGEAAPRQIVAGLALSFTPEALVGRKVIVVANLAPRDFGNKKEPLVSHGMLLASGPSEALQLATVDGDAPPGARLK